MPHLPRDFPGGRLRRLTTADLEAFQAYRSIAEVARFQGWSPMTAAQALEFLAEMSASAPFVGGGWVQWGIVAAGSDELVGDVGVSLSSDGQAGELGFTLAPWAQGRGLATEAARAAVTLFFEVAGVREVHAITDARNTPSLRLLERIGFEVVERRDVVFRGEPCTEVAWGSVDRGAFAAAPRLRTRRHVGPPHAVQRVVCMIHQSR